MKKIIDFFKNRTVLSIIGLLVLSLLIWFIGPEIKFGEANHAPLGSVVSRLIVIMVILIVWGLNNLRVNRREKKHNDAMLEDMGDSQEGKAHFVSEQSSEERHVIGQRFSQALSTLKMLKFTGKAGRKALYELPWYIIIGPPGSGKTTALVNSSLEFPLADKFGKESLQGVGGTRNCDWWFTNEAVLIDTAGRYTTQDSHKVIDSAAWDGFLGLLKKHRRRRPINGAIVAISLQQLLTQSEEERAAHARTIRARLDELMTKLEIRFPIYLILTKSDLISGFSEYFDDMDKYDREQVWGISLPDSPHASDSPDYDFFSNEYDRLVHRLYDRVVSRIHHERDVNRRAAIEAFPQQLENLKDIVTGFITKAFVKNRYQYQPYLRGVYFTSGTQDGTPIDRLMTSVSAGFGFDRPSASARTGIGKSYFLGRLFREVIFPESELVGANRRYELFIRWVQRAGYVALAGVTAGMLLVWAASFTRNEMYMHQVKQYIAAYYANQKPLLSRYADLAATLPALSALESASRVYDRESHPWLAGLGLYDSSVDEAAKHAYALTLRKNLLPKVLRFMESYLSGSVDLKNLYDNFRVYMMFHKITYMNKQDVSDWFEKYLDKHYKNDPKTRSQLLMQIQRLLDLHLTPSALDQALVENVRTRLLSVPVARRIYARLRSSPRFNQKVNVLNNLGDAEDSGFVMNANVQRQLTIPLLYTRRSYDAVDFSWDSALMQQLANENWVLSDDKSQQQKLSKEELKNISGKVREYYFDDYRSSWLGIYAGLRIKPIENIAQANDLLRHFVDPVYSPLSTILRVGSDNTTLTSPVVADVANKGKDGLKAKAMKLTAAQIPLTPVDKQFMSLNQLTRAYGDRPPALQNLIIKLQQLQGLVNGILIASDPGKKAFEIAKARYQGGAGNALTVLDTYADSLPEPVNRWMHTVSEQTWKVILRSAHGYVNSAWNEKVGSACSNAIRGRFPFSAQSETDVSMLDFTEYFKPGGTVDKFSDQYIKPFVDRHGRWRNKSVSGYSIGFSSGILNQISTAQSIKTVFFMQNPTIPSISFQLRPYKMLKQDERFTLELGDKRIRYSHGPKFWTTVKWSGGQDNGDVRLIFEDLSGSQHSVSYAGPWALFKLFSKSKITRTTNPDVYTAEFSIPKQPGDSVSHVIVYEIKATSIHNPFRENFLRQYSCKSGV